MNNHYVTYVILWTLSPIIFIMRAILDNPQFPVKAFARNPIMFTLINLLIVCVGPLHMLLLDMLKGGLSHVRK